MSDPGAEPRLVVPEGLVIDESTRERLERQLACADPAVSGIAAESAELEPGASYRVHAEWTALDSSWSSSAAGSGARAPHSVRGAVLVRPNVTFDVRDGCVEIADGAVLSDPGAHVHDPFRTIGPLRPASERGRPPFPRRPVVVFLACEPASNADWVRRLVNRLVRRDVEARIAMPEPLDDDAGPELQLTRPCLAGEETIRALAPDVVVTLDETAAARIDAWCSGDRSTVVVAFDEALDDPMELVSWQIGHAAGRLRARIGPRVDAPAFASLVVRLCAGPHPAPPAVEPELLHVRTPVREHWTAGVAADPPVGCVVLTGALDAAETARVEGLVDNLEGAGVPVVTGASASIPDDARMARLVLLAGVTTGTEIDALLRDRHRSGLPTAVDLVPGDVERATDSVRGARLTSSATALVESCALVVSTGGARHTAACRSGARVLVLPTLLPRSRAAALRDVRAPVDPAAARVVGWQLALAGGEVLPYAGAVAGGIARYLTESRDHVEIVGDADALPTLLRGHERVSVVPGRALDAEMIAGWAAHIWTPSLVDGELLDDARVLEEASCAGVPSIMPAAACAGVDGFVSSHVLVQEVDRPEQWYDALHHVLDDPDVRTRRAEEAWRRADALDGAAASKSVVSRLMGWAAYRSGVVA